jgi:alpha,alpha-trehalase
MVKLYVDATNDTDFAKKAVDTLASEFNYWLENHTVDVNGHLLARYGDHSYGPRPESFREDIETANSFKTEEEKQEHYSELKAAAESGMDFSSRWFMNPSDNWSNKGDLTNLKTRSIIPVELNAILYWNAKIIAEFYRLSGDAKKAEAFEEHADKLMKVILILNFTII